MSTKAELPVIERWEIDRLVPYEKNAKVHDEDQVSAIAQNIAKFGFDQPIVVDRDGVIIKGHGRRLAAIKLGMKRVPVVVAAHLSKGEADAARLTDNRVISNIFDTSMLQEELARLGDEGFDLDGLGFSDKELEFMTADLLEVDESAFTDDIEAAVGEQRDENAEKVTEAAAGRVPLKKAFGFADVSATTARQIKAFVAQIETETGATGDEAIGRFLETLGIAA